MELNGSSVTLDQMKALALTNYGHFTSMLVERGKVRGLSLHMERLARDCNQLFDVELDTDQVRAYIRRALTGGADRPSRGSPSTIPHSTSAPSVLTHSRRPGDHAPGVRQARAALATSGGAYQREIPPVKHVGLFGAMRHRRAAQREGFDDVLLLGPDGAISEIATSNIGFIRDSEVVWPRSEWLTGVTMTLLNQAMDEAVHLESLTLSDLPEMEEAFAPNAATGIRSVNSVDGTTWPAEHPALKDLCDLYVDIPGEVV